MTQSFIPSGKLVKTHGLKGMLVWKHPVAYKTILELEQIFLETEKEIFIPFFIDEIVFVQNETTHLLLESIDKIDKAKAFLNKVVFLEEEKHQKIFAQENSSDYLGYKLMDNGILIGEISEVYEYNSQKTASLTIKGKEILVPLHDDFIIKADKKTKTLFTQLPEGLLDL